jgi:hypothetical protein
MPGKLMILSLPSIVLLAEDVPLVSIFLFETAFLGEIFCKTHLQLVNWTVIVSLGWRGN